MPEPVQEKKKLQVEPGLYKELAIPLSQVYKGRKLIVKTRSELTKKGYDTTGYRYQFIVNRLNEIVSKYGLHWATQDEIKLQRDYLTKSGQTYFEYAGKLTILLLDDNRSAVDARACYGGHQASTHADAMKGAFTNAFKKTAALFGVGADVYEGAVDEDYLPIAEPAKSPMIQSNDTILLSVNEIKELEKETSAIGGIANKKEVEGVEKMLNAKVGKVSGKQMGYLRKLLRNKVESIK